MPLTPTAPPATPPATPPFIPSAPPYDPPPPPTDSIAIAHEHYAEGPTPDECGICASNFEILKADFSVFETWVKDLDPAQKQNIFNLISWLSFASYHYGKASSPSADLNKNRNVIENAIHGYTPNFPIYKESLARHILWGSTSNMTAEKAQSIAKILLYICHAEPSYNAEDATHTQVAQNFLDYVKPTTAQHEVEKISLADINDACRGRRFNDWPPKIKSLALLTTDFPPGTLLRNVNLDELKLAGKKIDQCDLQKIQCNKSTVEYIALRDCDLRGGSFKHTAFKNVNLENANAEGADFTHATMREMQIWKTRFKNAIFDGVYDFTLSPEILNYDDEKMRHLLLDHQHNKNKSGLLKTIDSIPDKYADLKIKLMVDVITALFKANIKDADLKKLYDSLKDVLINPLYAKDDRLAPLIELLIADEIKVGNRLPMHINDKAIPLFLKYTLAYLYNPAWAANNSAAIIQVLYRAENPSDPATIDMAFELRKKYMAHPYIAPITRQISHMRHDPVAFVYVSADLKKGVIFPRNFFNLFFDNKNNNDKEGNDLLSKLFWYAYDPEKGYLPIEDLPNIKIIIPDPDFPLFMYQFYKNTGLTHEGNRSFHSAQNRIEPGSQNIS